MDCLNPGDIVILTTPPAFRWLHFSYAIERGLNVFMEKPVTIDAPTTLRMLELGKKAQEKNLKVGVGLMCRHCKARGELADRIHNGEIGDVLTLRAYRMAGPTGSAAVGPAPEGTNELEWQIRNFHGFLWLSGGAVSDFLIHNIDEGCWAKGAWPVSAQASGGRHRMKLLNGRYRTGAEGAIGKRPWPKFIRIPFSHSRPRQNCLKGGRVRRLFVSWALGRLASPPR